MDTKARILEHIKDLMRAKDKEQLQVMRMVHSAIKQIEVDERITIDEDRMLIILNKLIKQRHESISQFKLAGRADLIAQEQFEIDIINQYLPKQLSWDETMTLVEQVWSHELSITTDSSLSMKDMGKIMAKLKPLLQGRADIAKVSEIIKARLKP